jgi:hypothetical protein
MASDVDPTIASGAPTLEVATGQVHALREASMTGHSDEPQPVECAAERLPLDDLGFLMLVADSYPHLVYTRRVEDREGGIRHEWRSVDSGELTVLVLRENGQHGVLQSRAGCYRSLLELAQLWRASEVEERRQPEIPNLVGTQLKDVPSVPSMEHSQFSTLLAAELSGIAHYRRELRREGAGVEVADEHVLVHLATRSVARLVVTWDRLTGRSNTQVATEGPRNLYDEVFVLMERWECGGRSALRPLPATRFNHAATAASAT